jgi:rhombotail lipoprotein
MPHAAISFRFVLCVVLGAVLVTTLGCYGRSQTRQNTSVVDYLYPNQRDPVAERGIPVLALPMDVAVAFVPDKQRGYSSSEGLTEAKKTELLEQVAAHFRDLDFIRTIEIIPSAYLVPQGGFANLDQIRTMYGVDAVALVSYDQTQFTDEGVASILYWTIVGAYVIPGEKNSTHTMVDSVIVHIPSRRMLFRAPGVSNIKGLATPVNLSEALRADSIKGFDQAVTDMIRNLDQQLVAFQEKVKSRPEEHQVVERSGSGSGFSGVGSLDPWMVLLLALLAAGGAWWSLRRP